MWLSPTPWPPTVRPHSRTLAVGASETYSCTLAGVTADFTNTASVEATGPTGSTVTDSDTADVDVIGPAITISKTPDTQQAAAGDTVTFGITVTNTGDVALSNVAVSDALASDCDTTIGTLACWCLDQLLMHDAGRCR